MYFKRKILITISLTIALMVAIGFSYAIFMAVPVKGNNNVNTITGNTISSSTLQPNIVVTYDEGTQYIDTGDLVLTTEPLNQIIKFKAYTIYDGAVNIEVSLSTVKNTLTANANYYLYECTESAYNNATYDNLSTTCTSIGKTANNVLPMVSEKIFISENRSVIINGPGTKYLVFAYTIPASNNTKRYIGVINANLKDMSAFEFTYDGTYIDQRVDGIGNLFFISSGNLTIINGKNDVEVTLISGGGGGGGSGGSFHHYLSTGELDESIRGGGGGGGGSGNVTTALIDLANTTYSFTIGLGGSGGANGTSGCNAHGAYSAKTATSGNNGGSGGPTTAFGLTANGGGGGYGGYSASRITPGQGGGYGRGFNNGTSGIAGGSGGSGGNAILGYGKGGDGAGSYSQSGASGAVVLTFS